MGCCGTKQNETENLNKIVVELEEKLIFRMNKLENIVSAIGQFSKNLVISHDQLDLLCNHLRIIKDSTEYNLIIACFDINLRGISVTRLITLCTLVSTASKPEKIKTLFDHYKENNNEQLVDKKIKLMISNIFDICVKDFINEAILVSTVNISEQLTLYQQKILNSKKIIVFYFFHYFVDAKDFLSFYEFRNLFIKPELEVLLKPELMRKLCFKIYKLSNEKHEVADGLVNNDIDIDNMQKFNKRLSRLSGKGYKGKFHNKSTY